MKKLFCTAVLCGVVVALLAARVEADSATYFRSDGGVAADENQSLPDKFDSKDGYLWRQDLAPGISTPCLYGDFILLTTYQAVKKELATVALDRHTGQIRWRRVTPATQIEAVHQVGSPASCSPACDGRRVYVFFGSYGLLCYDLDGNQLWSKPMGPFQDEFGANSSPILVDGKVILNQDHDANNFLIAVDQKTGKTVWKTPRQGFTRSYSTPIVWDIEGTKQLVVAGSLQLAVYDIETGRKLWWVNGISRIVDSTPVAADGLLYVATWTPGGDQTSRISMGLFADAAQQFDKDRDGKIAKAELTEGPVLARFFRIDLNQDGKLDKDEWKAHARVFELAQNVALAIRPGGKGDVSQTHVQWIHRRGLPVVPSPLVYRGVLYLVKDGGIVTSLNALNGRLLKQGRAAGRGNYYASPVAGDGKVYLVSERGVVSVLKTGEKWETLSSHDFGQRIMSTPVIAEGRIYIRTEEALFCFGNR